MSFHLLAQRATLIAGALALAAGDAGAAENLASPEAGGRLVYFSSQYDDEWKIGNLFDGTTERGWAGSSSEAQSIVIAFKDDALAQVEQVVIDVFTSEPSNTWAKDVEIEVSTTYPFKDWKPAGKFTLKQESGDQVLALAEPMTARYLKVVFLTNYSDAYMEAGELKVMGTLVAGGPPAPQYHDAAAQASGGTIASATAGYPGWEAANLLTPDGGHGWAGSAGAQEVVIALPRKTTITDISIDNYARGHSENCAKLVAVELSNSAAKGFRRVGELELPKIGDLHTLSLDKPAVARYVKLRFESNYGGAHLTTNRVRVWTLQPPSS